jgi:hypothetical protein
MTFLLLDIDMLSRKNLEIIDEFENKQFISLFSLDELTLLMTCRSRKSTPGPRKSEHGGFDSMPTYDHHSIRSNLEIHTHLNQICD